MVIKKIPFITSDDYIDDLTQLKVIHIIQKKNI